MTQTHTESCAESKACPHLKELEQLRKEVKELSKLVSTDTLTGLYNYRHLTQILEQEVERSNRFVQPISLVMFDVDHFKSINDKWGHEVGNKALIHISKCIVGNIRKLDIACRYGGEEFAVILPSSDVVTAKNIAERIRLNIENTPLEYNDHTINLTASGGLSSHYGKHDMTSNQLIHIADKELYRAKQQGRNQICADEESLVNLAVSNDEKSALFDIFHH